MFLIVSAVPRKIYRSKYLSKIHHLHERSGPFFLKMNTGTVGTPTVLNFCALTQNGLFLEEKIHFCIRQLRVRLVITWDAT